MNTTTSSSAHLDALQARFGLQIASCLNERTLAVPHDVSERLRFARERAIERARAATMVPASDGLAQMNASGSLTFGHSAGRGTPGGGWRFWLGSAMPLLALVAGLVSIQYFHEQSQITAAAEIDAALLADDLPPTAYSDPGFVEFLKSPRN